MLVFQKEKYDSYSSKTFRLPDTIIHKLEELAKENNTSVNKIVIQCLEYAIQNSSSEQN